MFGVWVVSSEKMPTERSCQFFWQRRIWTHEIESQRYHLCITLSWRHFTLATTWSQKTLIPTFSYLRNKPALSGSNSFPEEKQPCQDLVVYAVSETSRLPFTRSCEDSRSWGSARARYPRRSGVWHEEHAAACGGGHRHNRWPHLHQAQAEPTEIMHPTAAMLSIKWTQGEGANGGGHFKKQKRVSGCKSCAKSCSGWFTTGSPRAADSS